MRKAELTARKFQTRIPTGKMHLEKKLDLERLISLSRSIKRHPVKIWTVNLYGRRD